MRLLTRLLEPKAVAHAHCDLPCGVYDPAQARIEAESVKAIDEKYAANTDPEFRARCLIIKEQRSELVKHHLWVLWTDYFKPPHFEKYPQLHTLFNEATKLAGATGTKGSTDTSKADEQPVTGQQRGLHRPLGHGDAPNRPAHASPLNGIGGTGYCRTPVPMIRHERRRSMRLLARLLEPRATAHAHCDLPCGIYDPAQARIEAESVRAICEKYQQNDDPAFRIRALQIKEERSELVKHHLWVLWTDYFKPPHFEKYPQLHGLFNEATKLAGAGGTKGSTDVSTADKLLAKIEDISKIFWETKQG